MGFAKFVKYGIEWHTILGEYALDSFEDIYVKKCLSDLGKRMLIISPAMEKKDMVRYDSYLSEFFEIDPGPFRTMLFLYSGIENDITLPQRPYPNSELLESQWKLISSHGCEGHRLFLEDLEAFYKIKAREINPGVGKIEAGPSDLLYFVLKSRWNYLYADMWSVHNANGDVFIKQRSVNSDNRAVIVALCPNSSCLIGNNVRDGQ